jgi:hypothetical protein
VDSWLSQEGQLGEACGARRVVVRGGVQKSSDGVRALEWLVAVG